MMIITIKVGALKTNCYIVASKRTKEAVIIDPGDEAEKIIRAVDSEELKPILIIDTHAHPDHVGANAGIADRYGIIAATGEDGLVLMRDFKNYFEEFSGLKIEDLRLKKFLTDGETIRFGDIDMEVIKTPGHSKGSICLLAGGNLFSGDTLFAGTYGRTDIPGGSENEIVNSIKTLMKLPDDTIVYPGHGSSTTIGEEKYLYAEN